MIETTKILLEKSWEKGKKGNPKPAWRLLCCLCLKHVGFLSDFDFNLALHFYKDMPQNESRSSHAAFVSDFKAPVFKTQHHGNCRLSLKLIWKLDRGKLQHSCSVTEQVMFQICSCTLETDMYKMFPNIMEAFLSSYFWLTCSGCALTAPSFLLAWAQADLATLQDPAENVSWCLHPGSCCSNAAHSFTYESPYVK